MSDPSAIRKVNWKNVEREAVKFLVSRGWQTIATASLTNNNDRTAAPMMIGEKKLTILPDCFALRDRNGLEQLWLEVKGKTQPGYRYTRKRWEHGIDYRKFKEYLAMAKMFPRIQFYVILWEENSPLGLTPEEGFGDSGTWLMASLQDINSPKAHYEPNWPSHEEAKTTGGGWLWPRKLMAPPPIQQDLFNAF